MRTTFALFLLSTLIALVYSSDSSAVAACSYSGYTCKTVIPDAELAPGFAADGDSAACKQACVDSGPCLHWTYLNYPNLDAECYLLPQCDRDQACSHPESCLSGPKECTDCSSLTYESAVNTQMWTCVGATSPYSESIPDGSLCTVSCPTWAVGKEKVTAVCKNKAWDPVTPADAVDSEGEAISSPEVLPNPKCTCNDIVIPANTLEHEANGAGAELYCNKGSGYVIQDHTQDITIGSNDHCVFLCDRHPVLDFSCINGYWSDGVEDCKSIYCYDAPTDEQCGITPP